MRRVVLGILFVVLLTTTAGCGSLFSGSTDGSSRGTYEVPERTATPEPEVSPRGVRDDGGVRATDLAASHHDSLCGRSFDFGRELVVAAGNGTVLRQTETVGRTAANWTRFQYRVGKWKFGEQWAYERYWSPGDGTVLRSVDGRNGRTYARLRGSGEAPLLLSDLPVGDPTFRTRLFRVLNAVDSVTVERADRSGDGYVVRARSVRNLSTLYDARFGPTRNVTLFARVSERGIVDRLYLRFETTRDGRALRITEELRFHRRDGGGVSRPEWIQQAPDDPRVVEVDAGRSRDSTGKPHIAGGNQLWDDASNVSNETGTPDAELKDRCGSRSPG